MSIVVPFDGGEYARLALSRAAALADDADAALLTISVIHRHADDPVRLGWLEPGADWDPNAIAERLREAVTDIAPAAEPHVVRSTTGLPRGAVAREIRRFARGHEADLVVIGSENAGRIVTPVTSVGGKVATDRHYDVYLARRADSTLFDTRPSDGET
jgi:nucleotide-binding universal stress UspA family protein